MTTLEIEYWGLLDPEGPLQHEDADAAIEAALDAPFPSPCPREILICGWARATLTLEEVEFELDEAITGSLWPALDEGYCHEDGDTEPTPEGRASIDFYAKLLAEAVHEHYPVGIYRPVKGSARKVDCVAWVREHKPDWIAAPEWRGFLPEEAGDG